MEGVIGGMMEGMIEGAAPLPLLGAYAIDLLVGDPRWIPHPVVIIGRGISGLEAPLRKLGRGAVTERCAGAVLAAAVVGGTYLGTEALLRWAGSVSGPLRVLLAVWLLSTALAGRGLAASALAVYRPLRQGDLAAARRRLSHIVGRDTQALEEREIVRGTVETVAENTVDGVVSPLFYAVLGGAPLALAYKAVNTLDSMVGYRNDRYRHFGWASARLDDLANYLPARLTGLLMVVAARLLRLDAGGAVRCVRRDAGKHPSPNSGIPEAAVAGALGVRLGGLNHYGGQASFRPYLGEEGRPLSPEHILQAIGLLRLTSLLALALGVVACTLPGF